MSRGILQGFLWLEERVYRSLAGIKGLEVGVGRCQLTVVQAERLPPHHTTSPLSSFSRSFLRTQKREHAQHALFTEDSAADRFLYIHSVTVWEKCEWFSFIKFEKPSSSLYEAYVDRALAKYTSPKQKFQKGKQHRGDIGPKKAKLWNCRIQWNISVGHT